MRIIITTFGLTMPLLLMALLGMVLERKGLMTENFCAAANKLCFYVLLPCLIFKTIVQGEATISSAGQLILFISVAIVIVTFFAIILGHLLGKTGERKGAITHVIFRTNVVIFGIYIAEKAYGDTGGMYIAIMSVCTTIIYNFFSVLILSYYDSDSAKELSVISQFKELCVRVITNPPIIAVCLALAVKAAGFTLPVIVFSVIEDLAETAVPLSLLIMGASLKVNGIKKDAALLCLLTVIKLVIFPAAVIIPAVLAGFRDAQLLATICVFATPTAISCYPLSQELHSDHELTNKMIFITTIVSCATIAVIISALRYLEFM